jgi:hypothetical protein
MKTRIATIMLLLGLFIASTAFATTPTPATEQGRNEIKKQVKRHLTYPQFAIDEKFECCVSLSIIVNEDGSLEVDCANCVSQEMKDYVVKSVERIKTKKMTQYAGQTMLLRVKFDLI